MGEGGWVVWEMGLMMAVDVSCLHGVLVVSSSLRGYDSFILDAEPHSTSTQILGPTRPPIASSVLSEACPFRALVSDVPMISMCTFVTETAWCNDGLSPLCADLSLA